MEEEEKEKRKEKKRGEGFRNPGPSEFWAELVLGRLGFGPSWFWAELVWAELVLGRVDSRARLSCSELNSSIMGMSRILILFILLVLVSRHVGLL